VDDDATLAPPVAPGPAVAPAAKKNSLIAPGVLGVLAVVGGAAYFALKPSAPAAVATAPQTKSIPEPVGKPEAASREVAPAPATAPADSPGPAPSAAETASPAPKASAQTGTSAAEQKTRREAIAAREARERANREAEERARREAGAKREAEEKAKIAAAARAEPTQMAKVPPSSQPPEPVRAAPDADALYRQALDMERTGKISDAVRVLEQAANAGSGPAAKRLGDIYGRGEGDVSRDYLESLKWYDLARQKGESVPTARGR
jgi:serine/threonine-protein kinase